MTWIIPQSLTSLCAPGTAALISDSTVASQVCAQSLIRRSKPSRASCYLREWKAGNLMRLRSGLISSDSLGTSFATAWMSSLADTLASRSPARESVKGKTTSDTSGLSSQMEFLGCGLKSASLRMSKDTSPSDSEKSLESWKASVTKRRGEFSRRLNAARLISASGCSSWPTPTAMETADQGTSWEKLEKLDKGGRILRRIANYSINGWPTPTTAEAGKISCQPNYGQTGLSNHPEIVGLPTREPLAKSGRADPASSNSPGNRPESWATATVSTGAHRQKDGSMIPKLDTQVGGKLNPRWVETLMGLPVGWTMPSCASPVTIAPTNCASLATESSQQPQS